MQAMNTFRRVQAILLLGMALIGFGYGARGADHPCPIILEVGSEWLATGTITKIDDSTFVMLGKDNQLYTVRAADSKFLVNDADGAKYVPKVGDIVRVFGKVAEKCRVVASRVRVFGVLPAVLSMPAAPAQGPAPAPKKETRIIIEKQPQASAPSSIATCPPDWEGRGLLMDIDFVGHALKVRTSKGLFTINLHNARLIRGNRLVRLGSLNEGDALRVSGNIKGPFEVDAQSVQVTRTSSEAENALPQLPATFIGKIVSIDYPSMTFRMTTSSAPVVVLADIDTSIQNQHTPMSFLELKPGMRVNMSGNGNLGSGYVARHIQVISLAP